MGIALILHGGRPTGQDVIRDAVPAAAVLDERRIGIWMPEDVGVRLEESSEALAVAEALDDPVARFWALFYRSIVATEAADRELLDRCAQRFPVEARPTGQPMLQWSTTYARSWLAALAGDLEEAERLTNEALELGAATGQPDAMSIYGGQLVDLRWQQGRDAELVELLAGRAVELANRFGYATVARRAQELADA